MTRPSSPSGMTPNSSASQRSNLMYTHSMKRKARIAGVLILLLLLVSTALSAEVEFWGSVKSHKYHDPSCKWAQKIKPENRIIFKSAVEAFKAGYVPGKVCRPEHPATYDKEGNRIYFNNTPHLYPKPDNK